MSPSLASLLAPQLGPRLSWPAHNGPMSAAQLAQWLQIRKAQQVADPYGFAFGPQQPWYGYRPGPFGRPSPPPIAYSPRPAPAGPAGLYNFGAAGWGWGGGPNPKYLPLKPFGLRNPDPRTQEDRSWRENL